MKHRSMHCLHLFEILKRSESCPVFFAGGRSESSAIDCRNRGWWYFGIGARGDSPLDISQMYLESDSKWFLWYHLLRRLEILHCQKYFPFGVFTSIVSWSQHDGVSLFRSAEVTSSSATYRQSNAPVNLLEERSDESQVQPDVMFPYVSFGSRNNFTNNSSHEAFAVVHVHYQSC